MCVNWADSKYLFNRLSADTKHKFSVIHSFTRCLYVSPLPKLLVFSGLGCFTACNFRNNLFAVQSKHLKFSVKLDMLSDFRHGGKFSVLSSCFSDTVFVTLLCTAVETAISKVRKLLGTGGVPASLTLLFWRWLAVSSVFTGRSARTRNLNQQ